MSTIIKHNKKGIALLEIIVFFIVIGVLVGIGVTFLGPLTKKEKRTESRDIVRAAKEAVLGFAVANKRLPTTDEFAANFKNLDAWGNTIFYYPDSNLTTENICYSNSTGFTVSDIGVNKTGTAFIILSKGENGVNNTGETPTFTILQQSDTYDDIVEYGSIPELRNNVLACKELEIVTITLPDATEDTLYTTNLIGKGGSSPTWSTGQAQGSCPAGSVQLTASNEADLCLNTSTGIITGTVNVSEATPAGTLTTCTDTSTAFTVTLSQTGLGSFSKDLSIKINPQTLDITTKSLPDAKVNAVYNVTIKGTGGKNSYAWSVISGALPPGLTLSSTGVLSGTPTVSGTYNFTVQLFDTCNTRNMGFILNIQVSAPLTGSGGYGIQVYNPASSTRSYRRNGGACENWGGQTYINVEPGDTMTFYINANCGTLTCTAQTLTHAFLGGFDGNNNGYISWSSWGPNCGFGDL